MSKDDIISFLRSLPGDALDLVENYINGKIPEDVFVWRVASKLPHSTMRQLMQNLGYTEYRQNEWTKNPEGLKNHEMWRDVILSITAAVGGLALKDAIKRDDNPALTGQAVNDNDAINAYNQVGANIGDSQSAQSDYGTIFDKFFKSFVDGTSQSLQTFGSNFFNVLGSLGTTLFSNQMNKENMKELIDYQNSYNTPVKQMQRFADAGLNPNLIYGLGSNGNQPASGSIAPVDFDTAQRENRLAKMQIAVQTKQAEADIAQKQAYTNLLNTQQQGAQLENTYNAQTMNDRVFMVTKQLDQLCNAVDLQIKEIENWDDFRQAQMTLMEAQTYAGFLSGHSIFGKVTMEIKELGKKLIQKAKDKFPNASKEFSDMWNGLIFDFDSIYQ